MSQYYYDPFGNSGVNEESQQAFLRKQQEIKEKREIRTISLSMGIAIIAYLVVQYLVAIALSLLDLYDLYYASAVFQSGFSIIGISFLAVAVPFGVMALVNRKKYNSPVVPTAHIKPLNFILWIFFGMFCCVVANYGVSYIIAILQAATGLTFTQGEVLDPDSPFACFMEVISTAIIPAICEEFAMRCCSLQLLKKYGKGFAVLAVSIVFGLLHGNVIQFLFAFLIGMILAYVTIKTNNVIPAMVIHACSNGISALSSILTYTSGESAGTTAILCAYAFWGVFGLISLIVLAVKGELKSKQKVNSGVLSFGQKMNAFLFPWMIVPFLILLTMTILSIQK